MTRLLLLFCFLFTCSSLVRAQEIFRPVAPLKDGDHMPSYKGDCAPGPDYLSCSDRSMLEFIYGQIEYPKDARKRGIEGMAVVSFIVETDGMVSGIEISRDPGYGIGQEALRLVELMNADGPSWKPGVQGGEPVRAQYHLPIRFSLEAGDEDR